MPEPSSSNPPSPARRGFGGSVVIAAAILLSRLAGLVRQSVFAYYLGRSGPADAFNAAFRIPNLLQNLLGEGALSSSFIPVYAKLRAEGRHDEASRVASVVASVLALATSVLVVAGVVATPLLVDLVAPGFTGEKREATVRLVQIFFPSTGLLVLGAWCLGVLNSHRRFFLPYTAPILSSAAVVGALLLFRHHPRDFRLAEVAAWGALAGSALQVLVQLPAAARLVGHLRPSLDLAAEGARGVFKNFAPAVIGRGVYQLSAYIDQVIASYLPEGSVATLAYAQLVYTLPLALFGSSVSAAELPEMASATGDSEAIHRTLRGRLDAGLARIAFFVVPSSAAFLALGDVISALLFQRGDFRVRDSLAVWGALAGSSVGLLAQTLGRLYTSAFYALHDTRTPLRYATARITLTAALGYVCALPLPRALGLDPAWGVVGLTASAGAAGWLEFALLQRKLNALIGPTGVPASRLARLWGSAAAGTAAAWGVRLALGNSVLARPLLLAPLVLLVFGVVYLGAAHALGVPETREVLAKVRRRAGRRA